MHALAVHVDEGELMPFEVWEVLFALKRQAKDYLRTDVRGKVKQAVVAEVHTSFSQAWDAKKQEFDQTKVAALLKEDMYKGGLGYSSEGFKACLGAAVGKLTTGQPIKFTAIPDDAVRPVVYEAEVAFTDMAIRLTLQNKNLHFGQAGYGDGVQLLEDRMAVVQLAQRKSKFELETQQMVTLQRRSKYNREIGSILANVPEDELKHFAQRKASTRKCSKRGGKKGGKKGGKSSR